MLLTSKLKTISFLILMVPSLFTSCQGPVPPSTNPPNVLIIVADDFGWGHLALNKDQYAYSELNEAFVAHAQKLGYSPEIAQIMAEKATPTLTRLAQEGIRFTEAYNISNVSSPSRAAILTSCYPQRFGLYNRADVNTCIDNTVTLMPALMQQKGYATGSFGKVDYLPQYAGMDFKPGLTPSDIGFDYFFGFNYHSSPYTNSPILFNSSGRTMANGYLSDQITQETIHFIERNQNRPKLLYVAYNAVHEPIKDDAPSIYKIPFEGIGTGDLRLFYTAMYAMDRGIQKILDKLKEIEQLNNTIVIFLSDNGAPAPHTGNGPSSINPLPGNGPLTGFKGESWIGALKTPMIIWYPSKIKTGAICRSQVSSMDIFPTIFEATGTPLVTTQSVDGKSLIPILNGNHAYAPHSELIWMCQQGDYYSLTPPDTDTDPSDAYASFVVKKDQWILRYLSETNQYELYDTSLDKGQKNNIAPLYPVLVRSMANSFQNWYRSMKTPSGWKIDYWRDMSIRFR